VAISPLVLPDAHARTSRARCAKPWAVGGRRAHCSSVSRSSAVSTTGGGWRPLRIDVLRVYTQNAVAHQFVPIPSSQRTSHTDAKVGAGNAEPSPPRVVEDLRSTGDDGVHDDVFTPGDVEQHPRHRVEALMRADPHLLVRDAAERPLGGRSRIAPDSGGMDIRVLE